MPFEGNIPLTPAYQLKRNRKGKKMDSYIGGRGIFEKDVGTDLSATLKAILKLADEEVFHEGKNYKCDKPVTRIKECPPEVVFKGSKQDIRVKPSKSREKKDPKYAIKAIEEYINELNFNKDAVL